MSQVGAVLRFSSVAGLLAVFSAACGNDSSSTSSGEDSTEGSGGSGGAMGAGATGGAFSEAGSGGDGGTATGGNSSNTTSASTTSSTSAAGAGGSGGSAADNPDLAQPCDSDADCGSGLICVTAESSALTEGGPAGGLCTLPCTDDCEEVGPNAVCLSFGDNGAYCMPLCEIGDGVQDCAQRPDMVCDVLPAFLGTVCSTDTDCQTGAGCLGSECAVPVPVCLPKCRADSDCPEGRFCDPSLGECVDDEPAGGGIGEPCDPDAGSEECRGFCDSEAQRCVETCAFGVYPACGSDSTTEGTAECLAPFFDPFDRGDAGLCFALCDCTSDCAEGLSCISFASPDVQLDPVRGREGFCGTEIEGDVVLACE